MHPPFDPSKAVTFDFAQGQVALGDGGGYVLIAAQSLVLLAQAAGPAAAVAFAQAIGEPIGYRVARRLATGEEGRDGVQDAPTEVVVDHLGGEFALVGLGTLSLESWGRALVIVIDGSPLGGEGDLLLATIVAAALYRATGREVYCWPLAREGARARFFVGASAAVARVQAALEAGGSWGAILVSLNASQTNERGNA